MTTQGQSSRSSVCTTGAILQLMLINTHGSALSAALRDTSALRIVSSKMASEPHSEHDNTKLFDDIDAYDWDGDAEFQVTILLVGANIIG